MALPLTDVLYYCKVSGQIGGCETKFQPIWTEEGLCYTYNMLNWTDIFTDEYNL